MIVRHVLLHVQNVAWLAHYHGREAGLVGETVDAVELDTGGHVAYVDDRDGEASELVEAVCGARDAFEVKPTDATARTLDRFRDELRTHAQRRFLHGEVRGVRATA